MKELFEIVLENNNIEVFEIYFHKSDIHLTVSGNKDLGFIYISNETIIKDYEKICEIFSTYETEINEKLKKVYLKLEN